MLRLTLPLLLAANAFAAQFKVQFSADSGEHLLTAQGQKLDRQITFKFPDGFPVDPQKCVEPEVAGIPCTVVSASATVTFKPVHVSITPSDPAASTGVAVPGTVTVSVNFLGGIVQGPAMTTKQFPCIVGEACNRDLDLPPQVRQSRPGRTAIFSPRSASIQSHTASQSTSWATFIFGAVLPTDNSQWSVRFENVHIEGEMVVEVDLPGPTRPPVPDPTIRRPPEPPTPPSCPLSDRQIATINYTTVLGIMDRYPSCQQAILTYSCSKLSGVDVAVVGPAAMALEPLVQWAGTALLAYAYVELVRNNPSLKNALDKIQQALENETAKVQQAIEEGGAKAKALIDEAVEWCTSEFLEPPGEMSVEEFLRRHEVSEEWKRWERRMRWWWFSPW